MLQSNSCQMKDRLFAGAYGSLGSVTGLITGLLNFQTLFEAITLGFMGALGGIIIKEIWIYVKRKLVNKKSHESE